MGSYTRAGLAGVGVTCGVLLLAVSVGNNGDGDKTTSTQPKGAAAAAPPKGPYVALGDSYTAGPKVPPRPAGPRAASAPTTTTPRWSPRSWRSTRPTSAT